MSDRAAVDAEGLFCSCEAGRRARELRMARLINWSKWERETERVNTERAAQRRANVFLSAGIPTRFADLTINSFRKLTKGDAGKTAALAAAYAMAHEGYIEVDGVKKRSLLIWSHERGIGKTGLVTPVFQMFLRRGLTGIWLSWQQLVEQVEAGYKSENAYERLRAAREVGVLMVDDLGYQWTDDGLSAHALKVLNSVIFHRHAYDLPTLFTSNLSPEELTAQLRPEHYQRIAEMARVVEMQGEMLRRV